MTGDTRECRTTKQRNQHKQPTPKTKRTHSLNSKAVCLICSGVNRLISVPLLRKTCFPIQLFPTNFFDIAIQQLGKKISQRRPIGEGQETGLEFVDEFGGVGFFFVGPFSSAEELTAFLFGWVVIVVGGGDGMFGLRGGRRVRWGMAQCGRKRRGGRSAVRGR